MRHRILSALLTLVAAGAVVVGSTPRSQAADPPWLGVLQPTTGNVQSLSRAGVQRVSFELGWDALEPRRGTIDRAYVQRQGRRLRRLRRAGVELVLDMGLQYPPAWVFDLPGETRFVNQYGDRWYGRLSEDVPNAVFNPAVRRAQARHIRNVRRLFGAHDFVAVRVGGLLMNELRYPPATYRGNTNSYWAFDPSALARSTDPRWRPGMPGRHRAERFLDFYLGALVNYQGWLQNRYDRHFPSAEQHVLLPSWGLRPRDTTEAVASDLDGTTSAAHNDVLAFGLDWRRQLREMARHPGSVVYTTWLDAPSYGSGLSDESPIEYLAHLNRRHRLPIAGENTFPVRRNAATVVRRRVEALGLDGVMWMNEASIFDASAPRLPDVLRAVRPGAHSR